MRLAPSLLLLPALVAASSCTADAGTLYADVRWYLTCPTNPHQGCQNGQRHDFQQFDGDVVGGTIYRASCFAVQQDDRLSVSFSVQEGQDLVDVRGLVTGVNGGSVFPSLCSVQITEGGNTYSGDCGPVAPTEEQPCQVLDVEIDRDDPDGKSITVRMSCDRLPWDAQETIGFNVRDSASTSSPAELRLANCRGL